MNRSVIEYVLFTGSVLVIIGAVGFLYHPCVAAWVMLGGSLLMAFAYIIRATKYKPESARERRLERMGMLAGLHYFLAATFMMRQSTTWMLLFAVATVFFVYSNFAIFRRKNRA